MGGVDGLGAHTGLSGALDYPIFNLIGEFLCFWIQLVIYVAELGQLAHHLQGFTPVFDAQDTLEPNDAAGPGTDGDRIDIFVIASLSIAEGRTGGQPRSGTHNTLACWHLTAGELDPLVLQQALHLAGLLFVLD